MKIFKVIFGKREKWTELETLYTRERAEYISAVLRENRIPCKVRAALLPVPVNTAAPLGTAARSLWYLSVHPEDVSRMYHILRRERER